VTTIVVLSAIGISGVTKFGSEVCAALRGPGDNELALASGGMFASLLDFAGPAKAVARFNAQKEEAESSIQRATSDALLLRNWRYTQTPTADRVVESLSLYLQALQAELFLSAFNNFIELIQTGLATNPSPFAQVLNNNLEAFQGQVNSLLTAFINAAAQLQSFLNSFIPPNLRPPPIPPASPCGC
jgi:hypothetical protein